MAGGPLPKEKISEQTLLKGSLSLSTTTTLPMDQATNNELEVSWHCVFCFLVLEMPSLALEYF